MPVNVIWENDDHTLVRLEFDGKYSYDEYFDVIRALADEAKQGQHPIDAINVTVGSLHIPKGNPMKGSLGLFRPLIDTRSLSIYVKPPRMVRLFNRLFEQMNPDAKGLLLYTSSLEEARELVRARRQVDAAPKRTG